MPTTYYHTINGRIVGQTKNEVRTHYVPDALGLVVATLDANGTVENTYRYSAAYPTGFEHFVNDGGSSTQAWLQQGDRVPPERISGAGTRFRLGNWYWLREKPPISETPG